MSFTKSPAFKPEEKSEVTKDPLKLPTNPDETFKSRQGRELWGDCVVFPLRKNTTNPAFIERINKAQQEIYAYLKNIQGDISWTDKETRRREKIYKCQKEPHLAFANTMALVSEDNFKKIKESRTPEQLVKVKKVLDEFINQEIFGVIKECIIKDDGCILVRMDIQNAEGKPVQCISELKEKLKEIYSSIYERYAGHADKQTTLASVIGLARNHKLKPDQIKYLETLMQNLAKDLEKIGRIPLACAEWIEYDKRTLSPKSRLSVLTFFNRNFYHPACLPAEITLEDKAQIHPACF